MSGFTGIVQLDGRPVDAAVLERMTRLAEKHGRDHYGTWCDSNAGFGHCLLRSTPESVREIQPTSFDRKLWIIGDARVDERDLLITRLKAKDRPAGRSQPDIELILHAFHVWGEDCVNHFYGDFAFAVWDRVRQQLFCARDQFGIKPFYYAHSGDSFVFSNDLTAVRAYPGISDTLNPAAICDFLTFCRNADEATTCFQDIRRLPPAHTLSLEHAGRVKIHKYQRLEFDRRIDYPDPRDYQEHFLELFRQAIGDRLRTDKVGFELSGGLDSTSVATISAVLNLDNPAFSGLGITTIVPQAGPLEDEARFATMVTQRYGLQHNTIEAGRKDDFFAFNNTAQPYAWPFAATSLRYAAMMREHGRVMLSGQGADPFLDGSGYPLLDAYRETSPGVFFWRLLKSAVQKKSIRGLGLRALWAKNVPRVLIPEVPAWLDRDYLQQSRTVERWRDLFYRPGHYPPGCTAELAFDELHLPMWTSLFEEYYHELFCGIDCRHPLFDVRLLNFYFAIPASIKTGKKLLRESMCGSLPEAVRVRPKSILTTNLEQRLLVDQATFARVDIPLERCAAWIDPALYRNTLLRYARGGTEGGDQFTALGPLSLEMWIKNLKVLK